MRQLLLASRNPALVGLNPTKVLVRATNWIGDGVMMTPALGMVRQAWPEAEIVIAANPLVSQLFTHHPWCDRVMIYEKSGRHKGLAGLRKFVGELQQEEFDLAILFQKAFEAALLAFWAGIPIRAGFGTDMRGMLLTHKTPLTPEIKALHHSRHYLEMLRAFDVSGEASPLTLALTATEEQRAFEQTGLRDWLVLNPGAAYGSAKRWYPERFAEAGNLLAEQMGVGVVVVGGPAEKEIGEDIEQQLTAPAVNLVGKTTVREMMAVIAKSQLAISNDSGPMHIAAAFDVPTIAIFGPTDHTTTYPYTDFARVVHSGADCAPCLKRTCPIDHHCMLDVTAEQVVQTATELLDEVRQSN